MAILLCGEQETFEIAGTFDQGKFHKPADDCQFTPENDALRRALAQKSGQWIERPGQHVQDPACEFTQWLVHGDPDMLFVLPMRVKRETIGALLFAMTSVADTDQAMLSTLGTIYALHVGMSYTLLQVTEERRQMQNQLIMQEKMASLGSLVAGVTHEINNPVGAVQSATNVVSLCAKRIEGVFAGAKTLEDISRDGSYKKAFRALQDNTVVLAEAGGRIVEIVRSLKNFARLDEAEYQKADIHEGIDSTLTLLQSELKDRITVIKEYDEIPEIHCYPGQLNQVFMSLLKNASEAIEGAGTIRIKTLAKDDLIHIQISDSGKGIPREKLSRIFEVDFSQIGLRVKMGSGLATTYNIIQRHRGEVKVESQVGEGSSFMITLPTSLLL